MPDEERESIWSVSRNNLALYSILFPALWLAGMVYVVGFVAAPWRGQESLISLLAHAGTMGISSAVLSLMILAGKDLVMVLFDWANKARQRAQERGRLEGRQEGRQEGYEAVKEWIESNPDLQESIRELREAGAIEPPPYEQNGRDKDTRSKA